MGWQDIATGPRTGDWVWGEWPADLGPGGAVRSPRMVEPMQWGTPEGYVGHWLMRGRPTMGNGPVRWAPMSGPPPERDAGPSEFGHGSMVVAGWVIVRDPGCVPVKKVPLSRSEEGLDVLLTELAKIRPGSHLTVARLTSDGDLWVEDGRERLEIARLMAGVPYPDLAESDGAG